MSSDSNAPHNQEPEIAEVGVIARAEKERRKRGLLRLLIGFSIAAVILGVMIVLGKQGALGPDIKVEEGEQESLEETNDPQCRALIDDVTAYGERFKASGARSIEPVLSEEPAKIEAARATIASLREELEGLRSASAEANLRYENSRQELRDFFKFVDTELRLVDLRGEYQLKHLEAAANGQTFEEPKPKTRGKIIGRKRGEKLREDRTAEQKRDDSIIAIHDAFNTFRVWHTASAHPCGAADKGETPWTPPAAQAPEGEEQKK